MRASGSRGLALVLWSAFLLSLAPGGAAAATVVNGDFESGDLRGWQVRRVVEAGHWFAYKGTAAPLGSKKNRPIDSVQPPPQGTYAAVTDQAARDTLILSQEILLEPGQSHRLSLLAYYNSYKPIAVPSPDTLSVDDGVLAGQQNQQYRIDVMKPGAPLESVDPGDILRTLFRTTPGSPASMSPTRLATDLTPFAGQTVRLRIANAAHEELFNAGVDAVSISSTRPGQPPPGGSKGRPARFRLGKVELNRRRGTATLRVRVLEAGRLTVRTAPPSGRTAHSSKARKLVKPVSIRVATQSTVVVRLTPTAAARRVLARRGKLRVPVGVTFKPLGEPAETATLPVVFRLEA